jgi:hypothetical protein
MVLIVATVFFFFWSDYDNYMIQLTINDTKKFLKFFSFVYQMKRWLLDIVIKKLMLYNNIRGIFGPLPRIARSDFLSQSAPEVIVVLY